MSHYSVHFGAYQRTSQSFDAFAPALECFRDHYGNRPERARLLGATFDDVSDGLTESEREQVEFVQEQVARGGE